MITQQLCVSSMLLRNANPMRRIWLAKEKKKITKSILEHSLYYSILLHRSISKIKTTKLIKFLSEKFHEDIMQLLSYSYTLTLTCMLTVTTHGRYSHANI